MSLRKSSKSRKSSQDKKSSREQALEREWQRIVALREQNERLREELSAFERECLDVLREDEEHMVRTVLAQVQHLSGFLTRKSLTRWQRIELLDWIDENLEQASASPFCDQEVLAAALARMREIEAELQAMNGDFLEPDESEEEAASGRHSSPNGDLFEDLFAEFEDDDYEDDVDEDEEDVEDDLFWERMFEEHQRHEDEAARAQRQKERSLQELLKKSSINTLFRRLVRILHPDREQDPELKEQRHEQMTRVVRARDDNDVFALLSLYQQHTGESPLASITDDSGDILKLLKAQAQQLREQRHEIVHENPLRGHLYQRFHAKTAQARKHKLLRYCEELKIMAANEQRITASIRNLATLKPYLQERYEHNAVAEFEFFEELFRS